MSFFEDDFFQNGFLLTLFLFDFLRINLENMFDIMPLSSSIAQEEDKNEEPRKRKVM